MGHFCFNDLEVSSVVKKSSPIETKNLNLKLSSLEANLGNFIILIRGVFRGVIVMSFRPKMTVSIDFFKVNKYRQVFGGCC
jgi:hypothetical protein